MADLYGNTTDLQSVLTAVGQVKSEVDTQTDLIAQIASALEGKTLPDSGNEIKTCTVSTSYYGNYPDLLIYSKVVDGILTLHTWSSMDGYDQLENVACNTFIVFYSSRNVRPTVSGNISISQDQYGLTVIAVYGNGSIVYNPDDGTGN